MHTVGLVRVRYEEILGKTKFTLGKGDVQRLDVH